MNRLSFSLSSLLIISTLGAALPAQAASLPSEADNDSIRVVLDMTSLDLNTSKGWREAKQTIAATSRDICNRLLDQNSILQLEVADCQQNTNLDAMDQLESVRETQSDKHHSGHVLLAMSGQL